MDDEPLATTGDDEEVERACETLFMCIVTTLNHGVRNGGGIGDILRSPSNKVKRWHPKLCTMY